VYRKADGDHHVAGQFEQLCESVDLPVVQRPLFVAVPTASEGALRGLDRLQHWRDGHDEK